MNEQAGRQVGTEDLRRSYLHRVCTACITYINTTGWKCRVDEMRKHDMEEKCDDDVVSW